MQREILDRFGFIPNMFATPGLSGPVREGFWQFAKASYLDLPLPSLLKERLCVVLARDRGCRYGLVRHVGFLLGYGHPAGDRHCAAQSEAEVLALLQSPPNSPAGRGAAIDLLERSADAPLPLPGEPLEFALFACCAALIVRPTDEQAQAALRHAFGDARAEFLLAQLTFLRAADGWSRMHPGAGFEPDLHEMLAACPAIAAFLSEREVQRARARAEREIDPQESAFISRLSHDLRNPVAAISAVSDMFNVVGVDDDRLLHACGILQRQTRKLGRMLDQLADSANLALGKISIEKHSVRLDDVLNRVKDDLAPQLRERGLTVAVQGALPEVCVQGSQARLFQLFHSVLDAVAQKAVAPTSVVLVAVAARGSIKVVIASGKEGALIRQFHPHLDALMLTALRDEDPDLSLFSARVIAERHGGVLQALSGGVQSVCYQIVLPLETEAQAQEAAKAATQDAGDAQDAGAPREKPRTRVLAIEDNRDFAQLFRHMLEIMGCELDITADAGIGLSLAREIQPELIFCDLGLPGEMDGFAFARALRASKDLAHIPLVAVSGRNTPEDRQRALDAGFDRVCGKPVKFADISAALANFSREGRMER